MGYNLVNLRNLLYFKLKICDHVFIIAAIKDFHGDEFQFPKHCFLGI
jgi:hypothetical protein